MLDKISRTPSVTPVQIAQNHSNVRNELHSKSSIQGSITSCWEQIVNFFSSIWNTISSFFCGKKSDSKNDNISKITSKKELDEDEKRVKYLLDNGIFLLINHRAFSNNIWPEQDDDLPRLKIIEEAVQELNAEDSERTKKVAEKANTDEVIFSTNFKLVKQLRAYFVSNQYSKDDLIKKFAELEQAII